MITLINSGTKYHYETLELAAKAARSQAQVRQCLEQGLPELQKRFGIYIWSLQETWSVKPGRVSPKSMYHIQAQWKKDTWRDSQEFDTPGKALRAFLKIK